MNSVNMEILKFVRSGTLVVCAMDDEHIQVRVNDVMSKTMTTERFIDICEQVLKDRITVFAGSELASNPEFCHVHLREVFSRIYLVISPENIEDAHSAVEPFNARISRPARLAFSDIAAFFTRVHNRISSPPSQEPIEGEAFVQNHRGVIFRYIFGERFYINDQGEIAVCRRPFLRENSSGLAVGQKKIVSHLRVLFNRTFLQDSLGRIDISPISACNPPVCAALNLTEKYIKLERIKDFTKYVLQSSSFDSLSREEERELREELEVLLIEISDSMEQFVLDGHMKFERITMQSECPSLLDLEKTPCDPVSREKVQSRAALFFGDSLIKRSFSAVFQDKEVMPKSELLKGMKNIYLEAAVNCHASDLESFYNSDAVDRRLFRNLPFKDLNSSQGLTSLIKAYIFDMKYETPYSDGQGDLPQAILYRQLYHDLGSPWLSFAKEDALAKLAFVANYLNAPNLDDFKQVFKLAYCLDTILFGDFVESEEKVLLLRCLLYFAEGLEVPETHPWKVLGEYIAKIQRRQSGEAVDVPSHVLSTKAPREFKQYISSFFADKIAPSIEVYRSRGESAELVKKNREGALFVAPGFLVFEIKSVTSVATYSCQICAPMRQELNDESKYPVKVLFHEALPKDAKEVEAFWWEGDYSQNFVESVLKECLHFSKNVPDKMIEVEFIAKGNAFPHASEAVKAFARHEEEKTASMKIEFLESAFSHDDMK
jgi:hypothetical protein